MLLTYYNECRGFGAEAPKPRRRTEVFRLAFREAFRKAFRRAIRTFFEKEHILDGARLQHTLAEGFYEYNAPGVRRLRAEAPALTIVD